MNPKNGRTAKIANNTVTVTQSSAEMLVGNKHAATVVRLAYQRWQGRGCPQGDDRRDWFEAEQELLVASEGTATISQRFPLLKSSTDVMTTANGRDAKACLLFALPVLLLASCASSGIEPHAMTAPQHEAAAKNDEATSKEHEKRYDPSQSVPAGVGRSYVSCPGYEEINCFPSWSSVRNPTEQHLSDAKWHAELAAQHRAASQALREAEVRSCKNVPEGDQDISPFYHREDIISAGPFAEGVGLGGQRVVGAEVVFAALPGMTAEWLQRVANCHLARNAVLGTGDKTMSYCPLAVPHVKAQVRSVGNGFAVDVTSDDEKSVKDVIARAEALKGKRSPTVSN